MTTWTGEPFTTYTNQGLWYWANIYSADKMIAEIWKAMLGCGLTHVETTYAAIDYDSIPEPATSASN